MKNWTPGFTDVTTFFENIYFESEKNDSTLA